MKKTMFLVGVVVIAATSGCAAPSAAPAQHEIATAEGLTMEADVRGEGDATVEARDAAGARVMTIDASNGQVRVQMFESFRAGVSTVVLPDEARAYGTHEWISFGSFLAKDVTRPNLEAHAKSDIHPDFFGSCPITDMWCEPGDAYWAMAQWWNNIHTP